MARCGSLLVAVLACSLYSSAAGAQQASPLGIPEHPRLSAQRLVAQGDWNLFAGITLSREQVARVRVAYEAHQERLAILFDRARNPASAAGVMDSIASLQREQIAAMRSALSPELQAIFDRNVAAVAARAAQRRAETDPNR